MIINKPSVLAISLTLISDKNFVTFDADFEQLE